MRVLVVSDSHGYDTHIEQVLSKGKYDLLLHLGDIEGSEDYIRQIAACPCIMVAGNNDYFSDLPREEVFSMGKHKVFMSHGHYLDVHHNTQRIYEYGIGHKANIILYGHTHIPFLENRGGVWVLNPGSISRPRQAGRRPSYLFLEIDKKDEIHVSLNYL